MADIYDLDIDFVSEKLAPPELRTPIRLAWLRVLLAAFQVKHDNIFAANSFKTGELITPKWTSAPTFNVGDYSRVGIARYQSKVNNAGYFPPDNPTIWQLIETDFVGTDIRKNTYAGKMSFEHILNLYLQDSPTAVPTIYIATQGNANATFMLNNNVAPYLNFMPTVSNFQQYYMANVSTYLSGYVNFIVYVPLAAYNALGIDNTTRTNIVRAIVDKYNTAGMTYDVAVY